MARREEESQLEVQHGGTDMKMDTEQVKTVTASELADIFGSAENVAASSSGQKGETIKSEPNDDTNADEDPGMMDITCNGGYGNVTRNSKLTEDQP